MIAQVATGLCVLIACGVRPLATCVKPKSAAIVATMKLMECYTAENVMQSYASAVVFAISKRMVPNAPNVLVS